MPDATLTVVPPPINGPRTIPLGTPPICKQRFTILSGNGAVSNLEDFGCAGQNLGSTAAVGGDRNRNPSPRQTGFLRLSAPWAGFAVGFPFLERRNVRFFDNAFQLVWSRRFEKTVALSRP